ncbi:hypothetical protein ONZ43_g2318 [Nemania bipapillata]|uniref:Uncharacterized protein n=1 Tax=Nemania bipapillata TaxID=110536 RepID=A0ACC2J1E2_9PEZI|nr:hypothetical protein ONZ43_g2318 [Nemania bipapillata]
MAIVMPENKKPPVGKKAKRILGLLLEQHFLPHNKGIATDFSSILISRNKLDLEKPDYTVAYRTEEEDVPAPNAMEYKIRVTFTKPVTLSWLISYLTSTQASSTPNPKDEIIQALNIILGHHPKANPAVATLASNRHFHLNATTQNRLILSPCLQVIRGFSMSVRTATARILVNAQVKNTAFYEQERLDRVMSAWRAINVRGANVPGANFSDADNKALFNFVEGLSIDLTHINRTNSRGQRIANIKKIQGFAEKDDGSDLAHPPIILKYGAGAKDVKFFLDSPVSMSPSRPMRAGGGKDKGGKGANPSPGPSSAGAYISVFDYYKQSRGEPIVARDQNWG